MLTTGNLPLPLPVQRQWGLCGLSGKNWAKWVVFYVLLSANSFKDTGDWLFGLQVVQLEELLAVRHSVFVVGNAGTGKSQVQ